MLFIPPIYLYISIGSLILIFSSALISIYAYERFHLKPKLEGMVKDQINELLGKVSPKRKGIYKLPGEITYNNHEKTKPKLTIEFEVMETDRGGGKSRLKMVQLFVSPSRYQNEIRENDDIKARCDKWVNSLDVEWFDELDEDKLKYSLQEVKDSLR